MNHLRSFLACRVMPWLLAGLAALVLLSSCAPKAYKNVIA